MKNKDKVLQYLSTEDSYNPKNERRKRFAMAISELSDPSTAESVRWNNLIYPKDISPLFAALPVSEVDMVIAATLMAYPQGNFLEHYLSTYAMWEKRHQGETIFGFVYGSIFGGLRAIKDTEDEADLATLFKTVPPFIVGVFDTKEGEHGGLQAGDDRTTQSNLISAFIKKGKPGTGRDSMDHLRSLLSGMKTLSNKKPLFNDAVGDRPWTYRSCFVKELSIKAVAALKADERLDAALQAWESRKDVRSY